MEFREWLRAEMDAKKISPSQLARTSFVPQPTIFRILSGETKDPRTGTVKRLERAMGAKSPPIADEHSDQYEVVDDFAKVYAASDETWRTFLKTAVQAAKNEIKTDAAAPHKKYK
jgi:hypothetical protein